MTRQQRWERTKLIAYGIAGAALLIYAYIQNLD